MLTSKQIEATARLFEKLQPWKELETALDDLCRAFPDWSIKASLLKCASLNSLYSTNVRAIEKMAWHVAQVMSDSPAQSVALVERIAKVKFRDKQRSFTSFASKLCHFFVDGQTFPIFDSAARCALKYHLQNRYRDDASYGAFKDAFDILRSESSLASSVTVRELDRYLWLLGSYLAWKKTRQANELLRPIVEVGDPDLVGLLPTGLYEQALPSPRCTSKT